MNQKSEAVRIAVAILMACMTTALVLVAFYSAWSAFYFLALLLGSKVMAMGFVCVLLSGVFFYFYRELDESRN